MAHSRPIPRRPQVPEYAGSNSSEGDDQGDIDNDILVIGIDFGTTFSGVAWATLPEFEANQINLLSQWPGTTQEVGKAPTELFYEDGSFTWGFEVPDEADPVRWFKLLLVKEEDLDPSLRASPYVLAGRNMLVETGKTALDLITDYLAALWKHTLQSISETRGESIVEAIPFHVVITVPAVWKGYARQQMEQAARNAGILNPRPAGETTLIFVPEPEAAALSTLCEPGRKPKVGETYIICDAGGGTVDLINYKIESVDPICLAEAVEGTGGLCGGVFIDQRFERMCKLRLGRKWDRLSRASIKKIMKGEWEHGIKPQFAPGNKSKEYVVQIPPEAFTNSSLDDTSREPKIKNGYIHFRGSDIQETFEGPFSAIHNLVDEQVQATKKKGLSVTGIILVGGLGGSPYLYQFLREHYAKQGINILQSTGMIPRTAICRGAVYKGFLSAIAKSGQGRGNGQLRHKIEAPIAVTSTISRSHIGVSYQCEFERTKHRKEHKCWSDTYMCYMATDQLDWYLGKCKGDDVKVSNPVRHSFHYLYKSPAEYTGTLQEEILQCEEPEAPTAGTAGVTTLCTIDCTVDTPFSRLPDWTNREGTVFKNFEFEIEMVPAGAAVEFRIYSGGKQLGSRNANIKFM
ncbi:hypothetical protein ONZ43_g5899 [Nemania bipapillata]|uniref:Uncharacterized protein n=1 Tax=Nemania bipapillata TaxID=110536 RepID=A0ACC2I4M1_9PEZI|nr:hypothetical protein ONZ43_g5899 [Nemania bipapillata]